jgi:hypothetical protein
LKAPAGFVKGVNLRDFCRGGGTLVEVSGIGTLAGLGWGARTVVGLALSVISVGAATARDLSQIDFSLRLPAALSRFSPYSDVAGVGGASAGSKYESSINPAATDWQNTLANPYSVSPQYSGILFDRGPNVNVFAEAFTWKTESFGSIQPAAAQLRSIGSTAGPFTLLNADYGQIQWGIKPSENFAVGANFNYTSFDTSSGAAGLTFANVHSDTMTDVSARFTQ